MAENKLTVRRPVPVAVTLPDRDSVGRRVARFPDERRKNAKQKELARITFLRLAFCPHSCSPARHATRNGVILRTRAGWISIASHAVVYIDEEAQPGWQMASAVFHQNPEGVHPMTTDDSSPEVLARVTSDVEAAAIVNVLATHGIKASTSGGFTSGFAQPEAPGDLQVIVRHADLDQAKKLLGKSSELRPTLIGHKSTLANSKIFERRVMRVPVESAADDQGECPFYS